MKSVEQSKQSFSFMQSIVRSNRKHKIVMLYTITEGIEQQNACLLSRKISLYFACYDRFLENYLAFVHLTCIVFSSKSIF